MKIKQDLMTPKERMKAFANGEPIDRIPCTPSMGATLASFIGSSTYQYYHNAKLIAGLEIALFKKFRHDSVGIGLSREIAEAMGAEVVYPPNDISYVAEPAIKDLKDINRLAPLNPLKDGSIPRTLQALEIVNDTLNSEVNVGYSIPGPFTTAADLVGMENFLKALIKNPKQVHELLSIINESNFRIIDIVAAMGVGFRIADPVSSSSLISAKIFRDFSLPYIKQCVDHMREKSGRTTSFHVCGKSKAIWGGLVETGIVSISIDNVEDLAEVKEAIGDKVAIVGNVPPVDIMRYGSYENVVTASKICIKKAHNNPKGFILGTGCQIPINSPIENVQALMDTVRSYGIYPLQPDLW
ncbi:MAG: uroporphyrinogen decarboxylase family protein [Syntrophomonadaceae bacterium]|nr:uroporphyrinogen decarboxylase family protein [Syntrophomonadaceae bacterium]